MAIENGKSDKHKPGPAKSDACPPVAALLFDPAVRPATPDLVALSHARGAFAVTHQDDAAGHAELLCDGLPFDCLGLAPGAALGMQTGLRRIALPADFAADELALVALAQGPRLSGAGQLLPVVRTLASLVMALGELRGLRAVAWLPARLAMPPSWFAEAVGAWLKGGPFPALALTALVRSEHGLTSHGLAYFIGQEFVFTGKDGILRENDARGAVRLTDWLVAHGRVDSACNVELAGFGTVLVEPDGQNMLHAHSL